jgi:hypothetical protein
MASIIRKEPSYGEKTSTLFHSKNKDIASKQQHPAFALAMSKQARKQSKKAPAP